MQIIWCAISAHGFGHAAQAIPILNAVGTVLDNVHVILRTGVPESMFQGQLQVSWELQSMAQDIGCLQRGPLEIDVEGTWAAHQDFHRNWDHRVEVESQAIRHSKASLVISNVSYLAIASAMQANCPAVAMASLSWDRVLEPFIQPGNPDHQAVIEHMRREYAKAEHLIRLHPGIEMPAFSSVTETGPSFPPAGAPSVDVRQFLGMDKSEKLVFIAFGGVPLEELPLDQMEACEGFHFLVGGMQLQTSSSRIHRLEDVKMPFGEIMRLADVVMTKPGYATITSAVHYGVPVVYVRRHNFIDERHLVEYLHRYGRAVELTREDFSSGNWEKSLHSVLSFPFPVECPPQPDYRTAVDLLKGYLKT